MTKYYIGYGDRPLTEENALREYDTLDEAQSECSRYMEEIKEGVYDYKYSYVHTQKERDAIADALYIYCIETDGEGCQKLAVKLEFIMEDAGKAGLKI